MKKIFFLLIFIFLLLVPITYNLKPTYATSIEDVFGQVVPPPEIQALGSGSQGINNVLNKFIALAYAVAAILFIAMVIYSAIQWITSGGDKEAVGNARKRLTYAIIGIVLLALTFVLANILGNITGFTFFKGQ